MSYFRFIGDQREREDKNGNSLKGDGPDTITLCGVTFEKGVPIEVKDEAVAKKLRGNSHFEEVERIEKPAGERVEKPTGQRAGKYGPEPTADDK